MATVYADLIEKGLRTLEQVPERIREEVKEELERRGVLPVKQDSAETESMLYSPCYRLLDWYGREVNRMEYIASLIVTVVGGVICHYIIKWLDSGRQSVTNLRY